MEKTMLLGKSNHSFEILPINASHDKELAQVIRSALSEFGADKPGTVYYDSSTDQLSELFKKQGSCYFVLSWHGKVLGGAGIFPSEGLPAATAELVKMYLSPAARGKGLAKTLMEHCFSFARAEGYKYIYLETLPELSKAVLVYENAGFCKLEKPLGRTGHFGCNIWMLKKIS